MRGLQLILVLSLVYGCGGGAVGRTTGGPLIDVGVARHRPARVEPPRASAPATPVAFAETPITQLATALTRAALAAVERHHTEPLPVPTRRPLASHSALEVDWSERIEGRPQHLEVLGFAFELELILKRGDPPDDDSETVWGSIRATVAVSRYGLRLVELRPRAISPDPEGGVLPPGTEGIPEISRRLLSDLRRGNMDAYALTETDRSLLDNEAVWTRVRDGRLTPARVAEMRDMLVGLPDEPLAYRLDDVAILVRDERGRLLSLTMDFDPSEGSFALSTTPLVRVRQLWPLS